MIITATIMKGECEMSKDPMKAELETKIMITITFDGEMSECWRRIMALNSTGIMTECINTNPTRTRKETTIERAERKRKAIKEKSRANKLKKEELRLRELELQIKAREEALFNAEVEGVEQYFMAESVQEQLELAELIAIANRPSVVRSPARSTKPASLRGSRR